MSVDGSEEKKDDEESKLILEKSAEIKDLKKALAKKFEKEPTIMNSLVCKQHENNIECERKNLEFLEVPKISLNDDIYSLAYAAFLDKEQLEGDG